MLYVQHTWNIIDLFVLVDVSVCYTCRWVYVYIRIYIVCVARAKLCQVTCLRDTRGALKRIDALPQAICYSGVIFHAAYLCIVLSSRSRDKIKRPITDEFINYVRKPRARGFVSKRVRHLSRRRCFCRMSSKHRETSGVSCWLRTQLPEHRRTYIGIKFGETRCLNVVVL